MLNKSNRACELSPETCRRNTCQKTIMKLSDFFLKSFFSGSVLATFTPPAAAKVAEEWNDIYDWFQSNVGEMHQSVCLIF